MLGLGAGLACAGLLAARRERVRGRSLDAVLPHMLPHMLRARQPSARAYA